MRLRQIEGKVFNPRYLLNLCKIDHQRRFGERVEGLKRYDISSIGRLPPLEEGYKKKIRPRKKRKRATRELSFTVMTLAEGLEEAKRTRRA